MALSFNLDTKYAVIKQGPPGSFFGFAVAEHQVTDGGVVEQWYDNYFKPIFGHFGTLSSDPKHTYWFPW